MSDSLSNKELVAVGHQFAKAMSSDTPIIDMAKIVSRLAERLDCATLALREATKQRDALAAENAGLNKFIDDECYVYEPHDVEPVDAALEKPKTPATDSFSAEVRLQGVKVTLPTGYSVRPGHPINEAERGVMIPKDNGSWLSRHDVEHALRVAGIRINGEN